MIGLTQTRRAFILDPSWLTGADARALTVKPPPEWIPPGRDRIIHTGWAPSDNAGWFMRNLDFITIFGGAALCVAIAFGFTWLIGGSY